MKATMATFEEEMTTLTTPGISQQLPGAVLLSTNSSGSSVYSQCFGTTSLESSKSWPLTTDTFFWIASCTKLLASISALQLVERDLVKLDDPVAPILPELANPDIITGFNSDGSPNIVKAKNPITLRHLITHTSGLAYEFLHPNILAWWKWRGVNPQDFAGDIKKFYSAPLVFEPGTSWTYSPGLDWAGILISRLTKVDQLGDYLKEHIFKPLGISSKDAAFRQSGLGLTAAAINERWAHLTIRLQRNGEANVFKTSYEGKIASFPPIRTFEPMDDMGGGGLLTTPASYIKVLTSILLNDGKLLRPETVDTLFKPAIGDASRATLLEQMVPQVGGRMFTGGLPLPGDTTAEGQQDYHHGKYLPCQPTRNTHSFKPMSSSGRHDVIRPWL